MIVLDTFFNSDLFTFVILPILIFLSRIVDVTIGTIRIVMVAKGHKKIAPVLGFFEVFIWLLAITRIIQNLDNWICYVAYAGGFATGNYIGLLIEEKVAIGIVKIQIITRKESRDLIENLKNAGYGITHHEAQGGTEKVDIVYSIINRNEIHKVEEIVKTTNPKAFYSIEDVKSVSHGIFPEKTIMSLWRKGK